MQVPQVADEFGIDQVVVNHRGYKLAQESHLDYRGNGVYVITENSEKHEEATHQG